MNRFVASLRRSSAAALLAAAVLFPLAYAQADDDAEDRPDALPVTRLVLYTSGVGYLEHAGTVDGNETLSLPVPRDAMDDLLQSLVLADEGGGTVRPVRYASRDPLQRILQGYGIDLSGDPGLGELLSQARGEPVRVEAGETLMGTLVNVERVAPPDEEPRTYLTLSTEEGLKRVTLAEVRSVRFQRADVREELDAALQALSRYRSDGDANVRLRFEGEGERDVRVGYVREMPVWKTSYRLLLGEDGANLQGWALLDNPTDLAFDDVSVSFVAGAPISFVTELHDPVYAQRPRVPFEVGPNVVPPQDAGDAAPAPQAQARGEAAGFAGDAMSALRAPGPEADAVRSAIGGEGVEAMAQGARAGTSYAYEVEGPVTVEPHASAMVPILRTDVQATRLSLFDPSLGERHPLHGVRLENDTGLHLASGPVTVFDDGTFGGNARLDDVVPGDSRLLTYAIDLDVAVEVQRDGQPRRITAVRILDGLIETEERERVVTSHRIVPRSDEPRLLIVEVPKRSGYEPVVPEEAPAETASSYRYGVALAGEANGEVVEPNEDATVPTHLRCDPGETCTLDVALERTITQRLAVTDLAADRVAFFLENVELSDEDRAALEEVLRLKRRIAELDRALADTQARLEAIHREQDRIRQNMGALDRNAQLYRRYLGELETQEDRIAELRAEIDRLRDEREAARAELREVVAAGT